MSVETGRYAYGVDVVEGIETIVQAAEMDDGTWRYSYVMAESEPGC